jgi:hypothetical protein
MKNNIVSIVFVFITFSLFGQDVAISGGFNPATITLNGTSKLTVIWSKDGPALSVDDVFAQISLDLTKYQVDSVKGDMANYFTLALNNGVYYSKNTAPIPAGYVDMVAEFYVRGIATISPPAPGNTFLETQFEINVIDTEPSDNTGATGLTVNLPPLPVTYGYFDISAKDCSNPELKWSTESEGNNKGFQIERATEEGEFVSIGFVESNHNSTVTRKYEYTDKTAPKNADLKYRLNAIDYDGENTLSDVKTLATRCFSTTEITITPNPANEQVVVYYEGAKGEEVKGNIINSAGRTVKEVTIIANEKTALNISALPEGVYNLQMERNGKVNTKRFIKVN